MNHDLDWLPCVMWCVVGLFLICVAVIALVVWLDPLKVEIRQIKRRRRKERRIVISARELAKHREDVSVQTSRGFMAAFRETHR